MMTSTQANASTAIALCLAFCFGWPSTTFAEDSQTVAIPEWDLQLELPAQASCYHDPVNDLFNVTLGIRNGATFRLAPRQPEITAEAIAQAFDLLPGYPSVRVAEEHLDPNGLSYRLVSFEVKIGFRKGDRQVNRITTVSRVFARLPLDDEREVHATFAIEHICLDAGSCSAFVQALAIMRSLRVT